MSSAQFREVGKLRVGGWVGGQSLPFLGITGCFYAVRIFQAILLSASYPSYRQLLKRREGLEKGFLNENL